MYSMHKKNARDRFLQPATGFLLTEFIISFAVLSLVVLLTAHSFLTTVREYAGAKQRLQGLTEVQNSLECAWMGKTTVMTEGLITMRTVPVEKGIILPNMPALSQERVESISIGQPARINLKIRGSIREK